MVALASIANLDTLPHSERLDYIRLHREAFMGRIIIGVLTTGIYCLPSCTARQPKAENVRFFKTEAEAQAAGLRACHRCRPDYFYRNYDPDWEKLMALVEKIKREPATITNLEDMATTSGIGVTKLHALFRTHYQTTPAAYLGRLRLHRAAQLLADSERQIIEVAYAAGYESLSTFHDNFRKTYGLSPKEYQTLGKTPGKETQFVITLPENYLPWVTRKLLGRDPESLIERTNGHCALKALNINDIPVLLHMEWQKHAVHCRVESPVPLDTASMQLVHSAVIRQLGLIQNPSGFERFVANTPAYAGLINERCGLRIPLSADIFEGIAWAIIGQQINLAFAYKLRRQLAELCGQPVGQGMIAHPTPQAVANLDYTDLTQKQFSTRKAEYLIDIARLIVSGALFLDPLAAASQVEKQLLAVRGIGRWSANYIMMRSLGFSDCVPVGDTGLTSALQRFFQLDHRPDAEETIRLLKPFTPYRSLASYHLWMSLGENPVL